uniref:Uncharacterized protein n=1 Tax=Picea sitchensis TaxID=3332 RepID=D5ADV6_PICSI|nr:unknown [Picea sitchensis]
MCEDGRGQTWCDRGFEAQPQSREIEDQQLFGTLLLGWWKRQKINIWFGFEERHQSSLQWN